MNTYPDARFDAFSVVKIQGHVFRVVTFCSVAVQYWDINILWNDGILLTATLHVTTHNTSTYR